MKTITVNVSPSSADEEIIDAGVMYEHNSTEIVFSLDAQFISTSYKYYLDFATPTGVLRTQYLTPDSENKIIFVLPANITSLMSVMCYFNIVTVDETTLNTTMVIKPKRVLLNFSTVEGTDDKLRSQYDFSVNTLLEAIENEAFKGSKGDKGDKGDKGEKGDKGDNAQTDDIVTAASSNPVASSGIKTYVDGKRTRIIVDCPAFTNQPTITESALNSVFVLWSSNYYFVHIIDATAGTFKLMTKKNDATTAIDQTFTLTSLDTGNSGTLAENTRVDFLSVGNDWKMRSACVLSVNFSVENANETEIFASGISGGSHNYHIDLIEGLKGNDFIYATDNKGLISDGNTGFYFGIANASKNAYNDFYCKLVLNKKSLDLSGYYHFTTLSDDDRSAYGGVTTGKTVKGSAYKKDFGDLPIEALSSFRFVLDSGFFNGFEINVIAKERF